MIDHDAVDAVAEKILRGNTKAKRIACKGYPGAHTVWLRVGPQEFCVTPIPCDTLEETKHFRDLLANALTNLVMKYCRPAVKAMRPKIRGAK